MSDTVSPAPTIGIDEVARHVEKNDIFLLDVRRLPRGKQIYGAIRYDPQKLSRAERLVLPLPKRDGLIVLYDEDGKSDRLQLTDNDYGAVRVLAGGFEAWEKAGERTEDVTIEQPLPLVSKQQFER